MLHSSRLTLVGRQPLGASSLASGQLEVMLDRRLMQDDNRGLFQVGDCPEKMRSMTTPLIMKHLFSCQGVTDNLATPNSFYLLLERQIPKCKGEAPDPQVIIISQIFFFFQMKQRLLLSRRPTRPYCRWRRGTWS